MRGDESTRMIATELGPDAEAVERSAASRRTWILASAATLLLGSLLAWRISGSPPAIGIDDANITMVFASHIARGEGYVYFPGQERVEGSTSILWTALVALLYRITAQPETALLLLCTTFTGITILLLYRVFDACILESSDDRVRTRLSLGYAAYVATCVPIFFWGVFSMMDASLWLMLTTVFVAFLVRSFAEAPVSFGACSLGLALGASLAAARPEALLLVGATAPATLMLARTRPQRNRLLYRHGSVLLGLLLGTLALTGFRLWYFEVPFPNTYYAKVSSNPLDNLAAGGKYVLHFALADGLNAWFLVAAAWTLVHSIQFRIGSKPALECGEPSGAIGAISFWILLVVLAPLISGGDHFKCFRFLLPAIPLLPIPLLWWLQKRTTWLSARHVAMILLAGLLVAGRQAYFYSTQQSVQHEFQIAMDGRRLGTALNLAFADLLEKPTVGATTVGGIAKTYAGRILDLMGLCWTEMARSGDRRRVGVRNHAAFDEDVFFASPPDVVLPRLVQEKEPFELREFDLIVLKRLPLSERFQSLFLPCEVRTSASEKAIFFARRDWLPATGASAAMTVLDWDRVLVR